MMIGTKTRTLNLNSLADLELIRSDMIDWLCDCYSEDEHDQIAECSTAYLAKRVNKEFGGGLRAFVEADPELSLAC
jgi:hypothetical protein